MKFQFGTALDHEGNTVAAWGFTFNGDFIVNARVSPCGRFYAAPSEYGLTDADASDLAQLNSNRNLIAYWEI